MRLFKKGLLWAIGLTLGLTAFGLTGCTNKDGGTLKDRLLSVIKGEDGVGVECVYWTDEGELILVLTDGEEVNAGKVKKDEPTHKYGEWQDVVSTCDTRWQVQICEDCGDIQARSLAPKGHTYKQGVCRACKAYQSDEYNARYGFTYLGELEKGEELQDFYQEINEAVCEYHRNGDTVAQETLVAELSYIDNGLTTDEALAVWKMFKQDNPLFYWLSNTLQYTIEALQLFAEEEYTDGATRIEYNEALYSKIEDYKDIVKGETSEYQIALAYHDEIIKAVDYAYDDLGAPSSEPWAHSILGVFEKRGAVCESYAKTFQLLLNASDVENVLVTGDGGGESHAWNMARLDDGKWYYFDLTWDDTPDWEWGISYNYFAVAKDQSVSWSDGGWLYDEAFFNDKHRADTPTGVGVHFQYALPTAATAPFTTDKEVQLRELFTVDGNTYAVVGYNAVQFTNSDCTDTLVIPETVSYEGRVYTVISVGRMTSENLFNEGNAVGKAVKVVLPKTIAFIWDSAVSADGWLQEITVDKENEHFLSKDGVLFTKSMYTLIQYPESHTRTEYVIPDETGEVAYHAFTSGFQLKLQKLTLGINMQAFGMTNWGNGYKTQAPTGWFVGNVVGSDIVVLCDSLKRNANGQFPIVVPTENTGFTVDEIALYGMYDDGSMSLLYLFDSKITVFEIPVNLKHISQVVSVDYNFSKLPNLERFIVAEGNAYFSEQDGVLYNAAKTEIVYVPQAKKGELVIANGVTKINAFTFDGCRGLTTVFIPKSVKEVKANAFIGCSHLTIYCEAESLPSSWDKKWNTANCSVVWGYTEDTAK